MDTVEEAHKQNLRVTLSTVTRLALGLLRLLAHLDNDDVRNDVAFEFVETRVDLAVVELLTAFTDGPEGKSRRVDLGIDTEDIQNNLGSRAVVTTSNNHSVADDADQFALIVIGKCSQRVEALADVLLSFRVCRDVANNKLVLVGGTLARPKLQGSQKLDDDNRAKHDSDSEQNVVVDAALDTFAKINPTNIEGVLQALKVPRLSGGVQIVLEVFLEIGSSVALDEINEFLVKELVLGTVVVSIKSFEVVCQVVDIVAEGEPHVVVVFAFISDLVPLPDEVTLSHVFDRRQEDVGVPVFVLQGSAVSHVGHRTRLVYTQRVGNSGVRCQEQLAVAGVVFNQVRAGKIERGHDVRVHVEPAKFDHVGPGGLRSCVAVLLLPERREVVYYTVMADKVIVLTLMSADLVPVPNFVFVRAQELAEGDNVEDDGSVEEEDQ